MKAPTSAELTQLTHTIAQRVARCLEGDVENSYLPAQGMEAGPLDQQYKPLTLRRIEAKPGWISTPAIITIDRMSIRCLQSNALRGRNSPHRQVATWKAPGDRRWLEVPSHLPKMCAYLGYITESAIGMSVRPVRGLSSHLRRRMITVPRTYTSYRGNKSKRMH